MALQRNQALSRRFAKNLNECILLSNLNAYTLGKKLGLASPSIYSYTSGKALPSLTVLVAMCKALKITPNDLLGF